MRKDNFTHRSHAQLVIPFSLHTPLPMGAFRSSSSNDTVCRRRSRSVTSHIGLAGARRGVGRQRPRGRCGAGGGLNGRGRHAGQDRRRGDGHDGRGGCESVGERGLVGVVVGRRTADARQDTSRADRRCARSAAARRLASRRRSMACVSARSCLSSTSDWRKLPTGRRGGGGSRGAAPSRGAAGARRAPAGGGAGPRARPGRAPRGRRRRRPRRASSAWARPPTPVARAPRRASPPPAGAGARGGWWTARAHQRGERPTEPDGHRVFLGSAASAALACSCSHALLWSRRREAGFCHTAGSTGGRRVERAKEDQG
jgi:hypothetical protein